MLLIAALPGLEIVTGAGPGGGPHVKVFGADEVNGGTVLASFYAYVPQFAGGVSVAAGDIDGDGRDENVTGAGSRGGPHVKVFDGTDLTGGTLQSSLFAKNPKFARGVVVGTERWSDRDSLFGSLDDGLRSAAVDDVFEDELELLLM